jgi:hypothetical protein
MPYHMYIRSPARRALAQFINEYSHEIPRWNPNFGRQVPEDETFNNLNFTRNSLTSLLVDIFGAIKKKRDSNMLYICIIEGHFGIFEFFPSKKLMFGKNADEFKLSNDLIEHLIDYNLLGYIDENNNYNIYNNNFDL